MTRPAFRAGAPRRHPTPWTRLACALSLAATCAELAAQGLDTAQRRRLERATGTDWVLGATVQRALVPGEPDTTLGVVAADRGPLHLEGRWNYEAQGAGSLFAGINLRRDGDVALTLVPMLGVAFGTLRGIVPALEASVSWRALDASIEAEYVRDLDDRERSFLYAWSELGVSPGGAAGASGSWASARVAGQRCATRSAACSRNSSSAARPGACTSSSRPTRRGGWCC